MNTLLLSACGVGAVGVTCCCIPMIARQLATRALRRRCVEDRRLVLTFDDGPGESLTPSILDLLASADAKATFFLLGDRVTKARGIVDRIHSEGHEIGSHTQSHGHAWKNFPWNSTKDIDAGYKTLEPWASHQCSFRPPYGKMNLFTWMAVRRRGAAIGWWTIDTGDTYSILPDPQETVDAMVAAGGGVALLHDFDREPERAAYVLNLTRMLLDAADREGLKVCRLNEL